MIFVSEEDIDQDLADWRAGKARDYAVEHRPAGLQLPLPDSQLLHGVFVQDVDAAAAVYQDSEKMSSSLVRGKGGVQNQGIGAGSGHYFGVVSPTPADGLLRPVHELRCVKSYYIHLLLLQPSVASIIGHAGEHNIGSMLFWVLVLYRADWSDRRQLGQRRMRLPSRWGRQKVVSLGDPGGEPVALPSGVLGWLRTTMEFAGSIQSLLI